MSGDAENASLQSLGGRRPLSMNAGNGGILVETQRSQIDMMLAVRSTQQHSVESLAKLP